MCYGVAKMLFLGGAKSDISMIGCSEREKVTVFHGAEMQQ